MAGSFRRHVHTGPFLQRGEGGGNVQISKMKQSGKGLGSLFAKLGSWLIPLISKAAPVIKNTVIKAGKQVLKHPELRKVAHSVQKDLLKEGSEAASRLITGHPYNTEPDLKKAKIASEKVSNAVKERGLTSNPGPILLPKNANIVKKKNTVIIASSKKKQPPLLNNNKKKKKNKKKKSTAANKTLF